MCREAMSSSTIALYSGHEETYKNMLYGRNYDDCVDRRLSRANAVYGASGSDAREIISDVNSN